MGNEPTIYFMRVKNFNYQQEKFLLVIDEAHLYKGSGGAEVSLLIRRFCSRLDIEPDRLQVVCSTASFNDESHAKDFAATLTGTKEDDFVTITGEFAKKENTNTGPINHAEVFSNLKLAEIINPYSDAWRIELQTLSNLVNIPLKETLPETLTNLLLDYPPLNQLINIK